MSWQIHPPTGVLVGFVQNCMSAVQRAKMAAVQGHGTCTWRNRGKQANNDQAGQTGCETETGQDIPCNYDWSLTEDDVIGRTNYNTEDKFCACEYGYVTSSSNGEESNCNNMMCNGYGRIKYPGDFRDALMFEGRKLQYREVAGQDLDGWVKAGTLAPVDSEY